MIITGGLKFDVDVNNDADDSGNDGDSGYGAMMMPIMLFVIAMFLKIARN